MPRFSEPILSLLKSTMLKRLPHCFFTDEDTQSLATKTGLERSTVIQWAENLRWKVSGGAVADVEAFLRSSEAEMKVT